MASLGEQQLDLLKRMAALDPAPCLFGGYAEDALLAGTVTRPHEDIDWLMPRSEFRLRLSQASELGFDHFETLGESAPGEPFYLFGENGDLKVDLGVADEQDGDIVVKVGRVLFEIEGKEAPAGYQFRLPRDTFEHPPVDLDGIAVKTASPLAVYQLRAGIAAKGSFGPLSKRHLGAMRQLREAFFPDRSEGALLPPTDVLPK